MCALAYQTSTPECYWQVSEASETLSGVTQLNIGDIRYRASEASEILLVVDSAKSGICSMYIYMYGLFICPSNARAGSLFS